MAEKIIRLDRVHSCVGCGIRKSAAQLDVDHFILQRLGRLPTQDPNIPNPFHSVVAARENKFVLCREECHEKTDDLKRKAFVRGRSRRDLVYDPVALMHILGREYPVTGNIRFYFTQLHNMEETLSGFAEIAESLRDEFPPELTQAFQQAGVEADKYATSLRGKMADFKKTGFMDS